MRSLRILALVAFLPLAAPAPAAAVTIDQIVALSKAGVSEAVILALLERDGTVLTIEPEQLVSLKRDGLSDSLILAMLKNGREEGEESARAVAAWNAATMVTSLSAGPGVGSPGVVIVGHGPDRPNTIHTEDWYSGFRDGVRLPSGYRLGSSYPATYGGYTLSGRPVYRNGLSGRALQPQYGRGKTGDRALCLAQVNTAVGPGPAYVTECPAVMQKALRAQ